MQNKAYKFRLYPNKQQQELINRTFGCTRFTFNRILTEQEINQLPTIEKKLGVDLGLKDFAITSDGEVFANPKFLRRTEKQLTKAQRELSGKQKGSRNRNKARLKVAKLHEKIANQRNDFLHKLSTKFIH